MKFFPIDGKGGEQVIGVETFKRNGFSYLRLVTNYRRQVVFGTETDLPSATHTAKPGCIIAGLFVSYPVKWPEIGHSQLTLHPRLLSVSVVSIPAEGTDHQTPAEARVDFDALKDSDGNCWEPCPPPPNWIAVGTAIGQNSHSECIATFIDFSRPIARIYGLLAATNWSDGGFVIRFADGERQFHGYPEIDFSNESQDTGHAILDEEAISREMVWELGKESKKINKVDLWMGRSPKKWSKHPILGGIEFYAEDGISSRRWGNCDGKPIYSVEKGGKAKVVGLKLLVNLTEDCPIAAQALALE
ncbi:hypothetical protein K402DRAFT_152044 [Aulographum hederae CBS 113979]|uniref:Uncharacterized protein n=1 Tax=Aulographum hederae CBS 113979 TaxID=1176131 RepID=A0A6G1GT08_9PEZI|nr:hypothetical protein K402DRAFT_152044 [Aulographum hederae CBS 113979]